MSLKAKHNEITFGVGDKVRVFQRIEEKGKARSQAFEGMVIGIKGRGEGKTFTVRKIGIQQVGIERIFPLKSPAVEKIEVVRRGTRGVRRAKLYYIREKSRKEIEKIYTRAVKREKAKESKYKSKSKPKKTSKKAKMARTKSST